MWIKDKSESLEVLYHEEILEEPLEFTSNHTAQLPKREGEILVEKYVNLEAKEEVAEGEDSEEVVDESGDSAGDS